MWAFHVLLQAALDRVRPIDFSYLSLGSSEKFKSRGGGVLPGKSSPFLGLFTGFCYGGSLIFINTASAGLSSLAGFCTEQLLTCFLGAVRKQCQYLQC